MSDQFIEKEGIVIIKLQGSLSADRLGPVITFLSQKISEDKHRFIFDLSSVSWMGSMALGLLATAIRQSLSHNTRVRLVNPPASVARLLQDTSLLELCHVYSSLDQAIQSFH